MTRIIAIANQKGGCTKTSSTMNIGAALASRGNRVLIIDLDPQANLSTYLGFKENDDKDERKEVMVDFNELFESNKDVPCIDDLITDEEDIATQITISDLFEEVASNGKIDVKTVNSAIIYDEVNKIDYLPADINLANAETYLLNTLSRETVLKRILKKEVVDEYDFVLIDCLPSLGILLVNAFVAADGIIIPVQPQKFGMKGLDALLGVYKLVRDTLNQNLKVIGIFATLVYRSKNTNENIVSLIKKYKGLMFRTMISRADAAAKSAENQIALCYGKSKLGTQYMSLAEEVEARINE